ncbi:DUF6163 family protein [Methylobacterium sp. Leaf117]|uniref:DUF6163 family protein n=1 Tax=Methylobacterium sp. Leaf117 TaxID=1736260 RepID=UPI0006F25E59|nr:DUF6163 family protein [Methylobacterium sp. Leaf117]KQP96035.1 hypothetical protein ASF57_20115 [Methylobacterium sp. Leaf117]
MRGLTKIPGPREIRGRNVEGGGDRIERSSQLPRTGWDVVLIWFMRAVALCWLTKAVITWASILDVIPGFRPFESESIGRQSVIVYFAVLDPMAAVGLWLTSAWGGVVWLLAATSGLTLAVLTPQLLPVATPYLAIQAGIIAVYFIFSFLAAREIR